MIDEKIPATKRSDMWLLAQEAQVLWLVEGRISEHIKVTEHTKTIIEIIVYRFETRRKTPNHRIDKHQCINAKKHKDKCK